MKRIVDTQGVFLASPNDMGKYRKIVSTVVKDHNRNLLSDDERELKILTAMGDVPASITGEDAQFVINEGIADEFDFIIVILGPRIGSPTQREHAATIEEFKRAEVRHQRTKTLGSPGTPTIMVYFCEDPVSPFEIDADQLKMVHEFRDSIQDKGLYKPFKGPTQFKQMIKDDLRGHLNAQKKRKKKRVTSRDANLDQLP